MIGLNIYFHWPFCVSKCPYCAFYSLPWGNKVEEAYLEALLREIDYQSGLIKERGVRTIYFGGGTPSLAQPKTLAGLLKAVNQYQPINTAKVEICLEANPDSLSKTKLEAYLILGINRLSIGLQSANDEELKIAGRAYTFAQFKKIFSLARSLGFKNINLDLIFGLPTQTNESWKQTLISVIDLKPEHISTYSLELDRNSLWGRKYRMGKYKATNERDDRQRYSEARMRLLEAGYQHYEISNFCLPGFESKHNLGFWMGQDYWGFGAGAESYLSGSSFKHQSSIEEYLKNPTNYQIEEPPTEKAEKMMWLSLRLRLMKGFTIKEYKSRFTVDPEVDFGLGLAKAIESGFLSKKDMRYQLTLTGLDREKAVTLMIYSQS